MTVLLEKVGTLTVDAEGIQWITVRGRHIPLKKGQSVHFDKEGRYSLISGKQKEEKHQQKVEKTGKERSRVESEYSEKQEKRKKEAGYKEVESPAKKKKKIEGKQKQLQSHINKFQELNKKHKSSALSEFVKFATELMTEAMKKKSDLRSPLRNALARLRKRIKSEKLTDQQKTAILHQIERLSSEIKGLSESDFTEDYPVEQYERISPKGTEHTVKAHVRGEGKNIEGIDIFGQLSENPEYKTSFQSHNKKFNVGETLQNVANILPQYLKGIKEKAKKRYTEQYNKINPEQAKMYGGIEKILETQDITPETILKQEIGEAIQKAFQDVIGGRVRTERAYVENIDNIDEYTLLRNLDIIRGMRQHTVGLNWLRKTGQDMRGQLWEECWCGQEPVCAQCMNCEKHCTCDEPKLKMTLEELNKYFPDTEESMPHPAKGSGWYGESERHSKARSLGKADFELEYVGNVNDTTIKTHETENYIRKRQFDPKECEEGTYRTFTIGKGKKAVGCKVNGKFKAQSILEPKGNKKEDTTFTELGLKKTQPIKEDPCRWITTKTGNHVCIKPKNPEETELQLKNIDEVIKKLEHEEKSYILQDRQRIKNHILNLESIIQIKNKDYRADELKQELESIDQFFKDVEKHYETETTKAEHLETEMQSIRNKINTIYKEKSNDPNLINYKNELKQIAEEYNKIPLEIREKNKKKEITFTSLGLKKKSDYIDYIPLSSFKQVKHDFQEDFTMIHGTIARDGAYDYFDKNGNKITLYKKWDNLKEYYGKYDYLPIRGTKEKGAHVAQEIGFGYNFYPNESNHTVEFDGIFVNDLPILTDLLDPKEGYHVSPGYEDKIVDGNVQLITKLDHIAVSLRNLDTARSCTGTNDYGFSCTTVFPITNHDQNLKNEVVN